MPHAGGRAAKGRERAMRRRSSASTRPSARSRERTASTRDSVAGMGKVLDFMRRLWEVDHRLQSLSKRMAHQLGVTGPQRFVLRAVGRFPGASAGTIARLLSVDPSTLTGVLQRLENKKLVVRFRDQKDGRRALFRLTPAGQRLDAVRAGTIEEAVRRTASRARASDLAATSRLLELLAQELGE